MKAPFMIPSTTQPIIGGYTPVKNLPKVFKLPEYDSPESNLDRIAKQSNYTNRVAEQLARLSFEYATKPQVTGQNRPYMPLNSAYMLAPAGDKIFQMYAAARIQNG